MGLHNCSCSTPTSPLIGSARILFASSCFVIIVASIVLQAIFALTCQKIKGWKSDFAFYLLQLMALFSLLSYIGFLASYIHGLILFDSHILSRAMGSNYLGSCFSFVIANLCLTVHRLFYTLLPLRSPFILTKTVEKICISSILLFYIVFIAITLSPLASMGFCPAQFVYVYDRVTASINRLFNYMIGIVNVTAYTLMFATLFIKGSLTFKRNNEIRMTVQAALTSVCELAFFLYWEYGTEGSLSCRRTLATFTMLIYYDVLILPYMIFNKTVRTGMKNLFYKQKLRTAIVAFLDRSRSAPRQRQGV